MILQGYKTYIAAAIMATMGVLAQFDWISFLNQPNMGGIVALFGGILMAVLRAITTTPPAVPKPPENPNV